MNKLILHTYYRSSASYRVRIALNIKDLEYESIYVHLRSKEHLDDQFLTRNPQGLVPILEVDGQFLNQSLAIIEYLDARFPEPALLPFDEWERAKIRAASQVIACDIHPLDNLRVLQYLKTELSHNQEQIDNWYRHWVIEGFKALEKMIVSDNGKNRFCFGNTISLADICLVPQMYNAKRFNTDLSSFPKLVGINEYLCAMPAFEKAAPENQSDAE